MISDSILQRTFIPDWIDAQTALERTTHLGVGAHQDDLEFMALHGILECFRKQDKWFGAVTCTDGAGSARSGVYADYTDEQMKDVRKQEQNTAATIGQYGFVTQLGYASKVVKQKEPEDLIGDLLGILDATRPQVVYTHNPADKHASHLGVFSALLKAIRRLPKAERPQKLIGCEVWRSLDWLDDGQKALLDVSAHENLSAALNGVFDSQIAGGKRYDLAVIGRRRANATFFEAHSVDDVSELTFGIDLTALMEDDALSPVAFVQKRIEEFARSATEALRPFFDE